MQPALLLLMLLVLVLLTTSVLKQREVPATVSSSYVAVLYTAIFGRLSLLLFLTASISVFLNCVASVMSVDCAAVETGCMLEKYIQPVFVSVSATTTFLCVYSIAVAVVEKG